MTLTGQVVGPKFRLITYQVDGVGHICDSFFFMSYYTGFSVRAFREDLIALAKEMTLEDAVRKFVVIAVEKDIGKFYVTTGAGEEYKVTITDEG